MKLLEVVKMASFCLCDDVIVYLTHAVYGGGVTRSEDEGSKQVMEWLQLAVRSSTFTTGNE